MTILSFQTNKMEIETKRTMKQTTAQIHRINDTKVILKGKVLAFVVGYATALNISLDEAFHRAFVEAAEDFLARRQAE